MNFRVLLITGSIVYTFSLSSMQLTAPQVARGLLAYIPVKCAIAPLQEQINIAYKYNVDKYLNDGKGFARAFNLCEDLSYKEVAFINEVQKENGFDKHACKYKKLKSEAGLAHIDNHIFIGSLKPVVSLLHQVAPKKPTILKESAEKVKFVPRIPDMEQQQNIWKGHLLLALHSVRNGDFFYKQLFAACWGLSTAVILVPSIINQKSFNIKGCSSIAKKVGMLYGLNFICFNTYSKYLQYNADTMIVNSKVAPDMVRFFEEQEKYNKEQLQQLQKKAADKISKGKYFSKNVGRFITQSFIDLFPILSAERSTQARIRHFRRAIERQKNDRRILIFT